MQAVAVENLWFIGHRIVEVEPIYARASLIQGSKLHVLYTLNAVVGQFSKIVANRGPDVQVSDRLITAER